MTVAATPEAESPETKVTLDDVTQAAASLTPEVRRAVASGRMSFADAAATLEAPKPEAAQTAKETAGEETKVETETQETEAIEETKTETETLEEEVIETAAATEKQKKTDEEEQAKNPTRFRFQSEEDQAIAMLAKSKGISLIAAAKLYAQDNFQETTTGTEAEARPEASPQVDTVAAEFDQQIEAKNEELKALRQKRETANEEANIEEAQALTEQIADLRSDLRDLERDKKWTLRERTNHSKQAYQAAADRSRDTAVTDFPELADQDSSFRLSYDGYVSRLARDPKRQGIFNDPEWPLKLANELAGKLGVKPAAEREKAAAPAKPEPPTKPKPPAATTARKPEQVPTATKTKMLEATDGQAPGKAALTPDEMLKNLKDMTPQERLKVIRQMKY